MIEFLKAIRFLGGLIQGFQKKWKGPSRDGAERDLMGSLIKRLKHTISLTFLAACFLCVLAAPAAGVAPKPMKVDFSGDARSADPGEDPHLRIMPDMTGSPAYESWETGSIRSSTSD